MQEKRSKFWTPQIDRGISKGLDNLCTNSTVKVSQLCATLERALLHTEFGSTPQDAEMRPPQAKQTRKSNCCAPPDSMTVLASRA